MGAVVVATIGEGRRANMGRGKSREVMETLVRRYLCLTRSRTGEGEKGSGKDLANSLRTSWQTSDQKDPAADPGIANHGTGSMGIAPIRCHKAVIETETPRRKRVDGWSWRRS